MAVELTPTTTSIDYLIPQLRIHLWDVSVPYVYSDGTLRFALFTGLKLLMPRWNSRYIPSYDAVADNWGILRNPYDVFAYASPPIVQYGDERPMVLAASIALKSGLIYIVAGNAASWRDEEVSFSNLTGAQLQEASLVRDFEELNKLVPERRQRLGRTIKGELLGFSNPPNYFEG